MFLAKDVDVVLNICGRRNEGEQAGNKCGAADWEIGEQSPGLLHPGGEALDDGGGLDCVYGFCG